MPLVANTQLPSFKRLRDEGQLVLDSDRAMNQYIRELHIGILNLMPDAALQATERQFMRLLGSSNQIAQIYVHLFTLDGVARQGSAAEHVAQHYETFEDVQRDGLDALLITGANPASPDISKEGFYQQMLDVMDWSLQDVSSTMCSCLATHAAIKSFHGVERSKLATKRWGVYSHDVVMPNHPLVAHINTRFDAPHSHVYDMTSDDLSVGGCMILANSKEAGLYLATSADGFRYIYCQGHPEYDINSLLKEYKREVLRFNEGVIEIYPPFPTHYFDVGIERVLTHYKNDAVVARDAGNPAPEFPEAMLVANLHNTWSDTGRAIFNNWLGLVYQLTDKDRSKPFMDGVDAQDPLGLLQE
ncbi:MAG: homoserine O-succinyltransferase MetA [Arenicellales bacterium WSBS_2016_MAG_OTU3]